jgi:N-acetyl-alpha-D-muramate 1-phosphate uridylyltransferase
MSMPVAILAGGLSTRLGPITEKIPKALVDVAGKPFILRQLQYIHKQGIQSVVICLGHLGEQVEALLGDGSNIGLDVRYSWDGPRLLGTGGALKKALPLLDKDFFVYYGDSYLPIDFKAVERDFGASRKQAIMTVLKNNSQWDKSNVLFYDGCVDEYNKRQPTPEMTYIDYGLGILSASIFENIQVDQFVDLGDIYYELSVKGLLAGHEVFERFYEIGSQKGLNETIQYFKERDKA